MNIWPRKLIVVYLLFSVMLIAVACEKRNEIVSPASLDHESHQPFTFYNVQPTDGATEISDRPTFSWEYENTDSSQILYEVYMGTDTLKKVWGPDIAQNYVPKWKDQARAKEMLVQIYQMQRAYRARMGSYSNNGICASGLAPNTFYGNLHVVIDSSDRYTYCMAAACLSFYCYAAAKFDHSDPNWDYDTWGINETGTLIHENEELNLSFQPGMTYSWQVVAIDINRNRIASPIYSFTTTDQVLYPGNYPLIPCVPGPTGNSFVLPCSTIFRWYSAPLIESISYDFYLGLGDNLELRAQSLHEPFLASDWYRQANTQLMLERIYNQQQYNQNQLGCYRGNGAIRLPGENGEYSDFDSSCLWISFNHDDSYTYIVSATCSTFTAIATCNLDLDSDIDTWTIDQNSTIRHTVNDADIPYRQYARYSWKIVTHDLFGNVYEGPVWHFDAETDLRNDF
jgi:hypothetical protein